MDMNGNSVQDSFEDADGNQVFVFVDEEGNTITQTIDATTGEINEVRSNEDGLTIVHEEWDTNGNYVMYMEGADGTYIIEVHDYMGYITRTVYDANWEITETTKTDMNGNAVQEGYYDEEDNYVVVYFDQGLNADVTQRTDPWGYYTLEYMGADGSPVFEEYDPTGAPIVRLPTASAPQNL